MNSIDEGLIDSVRPRNAIIIWRITSVRKSGPAFKLSEIPKLLSFAKLTSNRSDMALNRRLKRRLSCMSQKAHVSNVSRLRHINSLLQWILQRWNVFLFGFSTDFRKIIWLIWFFGFRFSWERRPVDCYPPTMLNKYYPRLLSIFIHSGIVGDAKEATLLL